MSYLSSFYIIMKITLHLLLFSAKHTPWKVVGLTTLQKYLDLKGYATFFFLEIGSFYNSLRVKQLSFTIFESI